MTRLLTQAFEQAAKLPPAIQNDLARRLLDDLIAESKWDQTLARTQNQLERLADEALEELRAGSTREMGIDEL